MQNYSVVRSMDKKEDDAEVLLEQYYSVEFPVNGLHLRFQSKIWNIASNNCFIIVKENSDVIGQLKVGDVFAMKYYRTESVFSTDHFRTKIKYISKHNQGRFKGHYLVGLMIIEDQKENNVDQPSFAGSSFCSPSFNSV